MFRVLRGARDSWEASFLRNERYAALLAGALLVVLSEVGLGGERLDAYLDANRFAVFTQFAALLGALLGLVIAAGALVLDRVAEGRLAVVAESRHGATLWETFKSAMWALALSTLLAVLVLIPTTCPLIDRIVVYVWAFSALLVILRLSRTVWIVGRLMDIVSSQEDKTR